MTARRAYPSDISDARWALIGPTLLAWQQARLDRRPTEEPARTDVREVLNAIFYVNRTGIAWKYLPHDFPPHTTVYYYYAAWRDEGIFAQPDIELGEDTLLPDTQDADESGVHDADERVGESGVVVGTVSGYVGKVSQLWTRRSRRAVRAADGSSARPISGRQMPGRVVQISRPAPQRAGVPASAG